jgi:hypothetical protein
MLMDPDSYPGGPKKYGSGSGSATLENHIIKLSQFLNVMLSVSHSWIESEERDRERERKFSVSSEIEMPTSRSFISNFYLYF